MSVVKGSRAIIFPLLATIAVACATPPREVADADARIHYYAAQLRAHPDVYAYHLGLAQAYLDKARMTHDPAFIRAAVTESDASLAILESLEGVKMKARIAAYRHRFEEALEWTEKAKALTTADIEDGAVTALRVEALMGLNRKEEARTLLPAGIEEAANFHIAAAFGHYFKASNEPDLAARAFSRAGEFAAQQGAKELAAWAETSAAGVFLDIGEAPRALPYLNNAQMLDPKSRFLQIHFAELDEINGEKRPALLRYENLIAEADDPELRRRAFLLARSLGETARAELHFHAAERKLRVAADAGEIFARDDLKRLFQDANRARN